MQNKVVTGSKVIAVIPLVEWLMKYATPQQKEDARVASGEGLVYFGVDVQFVQGREMVAVGGAG